MPRLRITAIALLIVGLALSIEFRRRYNNAMPPAEIAQALFLPVVLAISFVKPLREKAARAINRLRTPSRRTIAITAIVIAIASFLYLWKAAELHGRDLSPGMHDEFSYIIQSQLLARGKLWLPQPELADFFETFHVIVKPVYASVYFPGTALLYVPGVWMKLPHHLTSLALCAICVSLIYLLILMLLDGAFALLAAAMLLSTAIFYFSSTMALSNIPAMMFAMIALIGWLRWRRSETRSARLIWAAVIGLSAGWGMIVRPVDLFAYLLPLSIIMLFDLRRLHRPWIGTVAMIVIFAAPFFALQLVFNKGITNSWTTTPYRFYFDQFQPQTSIGFVRDDPSIGPRTTLQQKIDLYEIFLRPRIQENNAGKIIELLLRWRIKFVIGATLPAYPLIVLLPIGIVGACHHWTTRLICIAVPILYLGIYTFYPYFMPYYPLAIAPPIVLLCLLGVKEVGRAFENHRSATVLAMTGAFALCVAAIPEVRLDFGKEKYAIPRLGGLNQLIEANIQPPAVILFKYGAPSSPHNEPVYNYGGADPMGAPVLRAHDLGPERNRQIISYFAIHRPQTMFYRIDRGTQLKEQLGTAIDLQRQGEGLIPPATVPSAR